MIAGLSTISGRYFHLEDTCPFCGMTTARLIPMREGDSGFRLACDVCNVEWLVNT